MSFENLSQQGAGGRMGEVFDYDKMEKEKLLLSFRSKIDEKNNLPEIMAFFKEKDEENSDMFEKHPDTDVKSVLLKSRIAMHQVKDHNKMIVKKPRFYHPKIG